MPGRDPGIRRAGNPRLSQMDSGNHRPTGPIANLAQASIRRQAIRNWEWQRDLVDMYAFHLQVPPGTREVEASLDLITYNGKDLAGFQQGH